MTYRERRDEIYKVLDEGAILPMPEARLVDQLIALCGELIDEVTRLRKRDKVVECVLAGAKELKKLGPFDDAVSWLERSLAALDEQKEEEDEQD